MGSGRTKSGLGFVWLLAALLVAVELAHDVSGFGSDAVDDFFMHWWHNALICVAAALGVVGALRSTRERLAWGLIAAALVSWAMGDVLWSLLYGSDPNAPAVSVADILWLLWYPLSGAALVLLIRDRVPGFELHRWIDGVVVVLIVATPWVVLFLEPVAEASGLDPLSEFSEFAYPLADFILVGGILGVFAIMGWRPGRTWLLLGLGFGVISVADAVTSIEIVGQSDKQSVYGAVVLTGAFLISYASWQPHPGRLEARPIFGWRAIVLPVFAIGAAAVIQIYGYFHELPRSENLFTLIVLVLSLVQTVVGRPRRESAGERERTKALT